MDQVTDFEFKLQKPEVFKKKFYRGKCRNQTRTVDIKEEERGHSSLLMKDQIKNWLPVLTSTLQAPKKTEKPRPSTQQAQTRRKKQSSTQVVDLQRIALKED